MLLAGYLAVLAGMTVASWLVIASAREVFRIGADLYTHPFTVSNAALDARHAASSIRNVMLYAILSEDARQLAQARAEVAELNDRLTENLDVIGKYFLGDLGEVEKARRDAAAWTDIRERIRAAAAAGDFHQAGELARTVGTDAFNSLSARLDYVVWFARNKAATFARQAQEESARANSRALWVLGLFALACLGMGLNSTRRIIGRLAEDEAGLRQAASVFDNTGDAVMITKPDGTILAVNRSFTRITGYGAAEVLGKPPSVIKSDRHQPEFYRAFWEDLRARGHWQGEIWNRRKDGEAFLAWESVSAVRDRDGRVDRYVAVFSDITELHRKDEQIKHQAFHDALTGLPNRLLLSDRLEHALSMARRYGAELALMFIDLNRFKVINDSLGHEAGDTLLVEVAERLKSTLRKSDTVARMGGDEFVVLITGFDDTNLVVNVAEKISLAMAEPVELGGRPLQVSASIGIALYPRDGQDALTLLKNADTAMFKAKKQDCESFCFFDQAMNDTAVERLEMEVALRRAIERKEFFLVYQPKIDLRTSVMVGVEALIRWNRPGFGTVSPASFIPLAEEVGLIGRIGDWVLEETCRQIDDWRVRGVDPPCVAVNVSARQFMSGDFADHVMAILGKYGVLPALIEVEITESAMMGDPEVAIRQIKALKDKGIAVSVDDFGTGYSSLSYLKQLPVGLIKVDRGFVRNVGSDKDNAAIVKAIQGMASALGLGMVAEGIESGEEEAFLKELGYGVGQGYRYATPLSPAELERWMDGRTMTCLTRGLPD
jgi:diguanylate cyclase (GGDEF)-like protein/PAS domain S-box-containing protein